MTGTPTVQHELTVNGDGPLTVAALRRLLDATDVRAVPNGARVSIRHEDSQREGAYWAATIRWAD